MPGTPSLPFKLFFFPLGTPFFSLHLFFIVLGLGLGRTIEEDQSSLTIYTVNMATATNEKRKSFDKKDTGKYAGSKKSKKEEPPPANKRDLKHQRQSSGISCALKRIPPSRTVS
jgi:hypothetical protein